MTKRLPPSVGASQLLLPLLQAKVPPMAKQQSRANADDTDPHYLSGTRIYSSWAAMHSRCYSKSNPNFKYYGGRGIEVCARWNSVNAFLDDMGHPASGHSIGRINNDGNYEPSNCRWETQEEQNENTSRNRYIEYDCRSQTLKAWAKEYDISPVRLSERIRRGWSVDKALTTPCPTNYETGRSRHNEAAKRQWEMNGARYRNASSARGSNTSPPTPTPSTP